MCRLALIDIVQIELVVGADRDVDFFFRIPIEISEVQRVGPVRIHLPAVEGGTDILTSRIFDLSAVNHEDTKAQRNSAKQICDYLSFWQHFPGQ